MMMVRRSKGLGERHEKILELLRKAGERGYPPSIREIGEECGISSTSVVNYYLTQLEEWGYIDRTDKISRSIRIKHPLAQAAENVSKAVEKTASAASKAITDMLAIPIYGAIGASPLLPDVGAFSTDPIGMLDVARSMVAVRNPNDLFALEVRGSSMIDAMVNDGDYVIMKKELNTDAVHNGDMVAIYLEDSHETTLKSFYREKDGRVRLQPANPTMEPIYIEKNTSFQIQGKVVMIVRKFPNVH